MPKTALRIFALQWATNLLAIDAQDLYRIAESKPEAFNEWLADLTWCREQWPQEAELFAVAIEKLIVAGRPHR